MSPTETEDFKVAIGAELARLREKRGWSQRELADFAGVPQPTISALERGVRMPGLDTFLAIVEALGTSPNDILEKAGYLPSECVIISWHCGFLILPHHDPIIG